MHIQHIQASSCREQENTSSIAIVGDDSCRQFAAKAIRLRFDSDLVSQFGAAQKPL
jgi:hypothetical protein